MVARFATTQWSVVLRARDGPGTVARDALATLCEWYWYPIYAFVQRSGCEPVEAQDLTQAYFTRLLERDFLASVRPEAGRFRSFILASVRHFLANEWDRQKAQKRGGHLQRVSLATEPAAERIDVELADHLTPEDVFEKRWAQTLCERVLTTLQGEWEKRGKGEQFRYFEGFLTASQPDTTHSELSAKLGMSKGATRVAVHRLRRRYGKLLREEIARTVSDPSEVDAELRHVLEVLAD